MKKIVLIFILIFIILFLTSCMDPYKIEDGQKVFYRNGFRIIEKREEIKIVCDPETKIMYYMCGSAGTNNFCLTPYYIVKNGKAEIAIYGKNYFD